MHMQTWPYSCAWEPSFSRKDMKIHTFLPCCHWCIFIWKIRRFREGLLVFFFFNLCIKLMYLLFMILKKTPILFLQNRTMYTSKINKNAFTMWIKHNNIVYYFIWFKHKPLFSLWITERTMMLELLIRSHLFVISSEMQNLHAKSGSSTLTVVVNSPTTTTKRTRKLFHIYSFITSST